MKFKERLSKMKFKNDNLATVLITTFSTSLGIVILSIGSLVFVAGSTQILNATAEHVDAISAGITKKLGTSVGDMSSLLNVLSSDPVVIKGMKALKEHNGAILGDASKIDDPAIKAFRNKMDTIVESYGAINLAFVATTNDQVMAHPAAPFPQGYKVTERPWYQEGIAAGTINLSNPYQDVSSGLTRFNLTIPVKSGGETLGVIAFDMNLQALAEETKELTVGEKGWTGLAVKDGDSFRMFYNSDEEMNKVLNEKTLKEQVLDSEKEVSVPGLVEILKDAKIDTEASDRYETVKINNTDYQIAARLDERLGMYKLIAIDDSEYISKPMSLLKAASITAILVGGATLAVLSRRLKKIGKDLTDINEAVSKVKEGDLTVQLEGEILEVAHESGQLANNLNNTTSILRGLVGNINEASNGLTKAATDVSSSAAETNARIEEIATTMNDIVEGISEQASHAENSNSAVLQLAERLEQLKDASSSMADLTEEVKRENEQGLASVNDLQYYTEENNKSSKAVADNINELSKKTESIETIVDTMSGIAEQTNLLALNAAIEAARAGEMGAGFSVVAGEVKKLAEQSAKHAETIRGIVTAIQKDVDSSVVVMNNAIKIAGEQTKAVDTVVDAFKTISNSTESMNQSITDIDGFVNIINEDKDTIVESIERIARVSQRSAASSQQISASIQEQTALTQSLADTAGQLNELAEGLVNDVNKFEI